MTQEEWLAQYIESAFAGVTLGEGIDIHAAQSMDQYGNPHEDALSRTAERNDWRRVSADVLFPRFWAITFLDAWGLRFYAPAVMTALLGPPVAEECLSIWFLCNLTIAPDGTVKGVPFDELFDTRQRAALVRFLKYLIHNRTREFGGDSDAARRLSEIQSRTSLERR